MKNIYAFAKRGLALLVATAVLAPSIVSAQWSAGINNAQSAGTPQGTIFDIIKTTTNWLLGILGFLGIIGFVIAGILYLTAAGDEERSGSAKNALMWSIYGVVVALLGFVIIQAATTWLGGQSTSF